MATQIATANETAIALSPAAERFNLHQRQARVFASSHLVPDHLRKGPPEQAMANCYIALTLAEAMNELPLIVMQNIYVVAGKAGFAAKFMIARANASGKFKDDLDWEVSGKGPSLSVTCFAKLAKSGKRVEMTCDMDMAKAEGWTKNAKYQTMPEVMLRYRSASFLVNMYAPEVMLGYRTIEEIEDVAVAAKADDVPLTAAMLIEQANTESEPVSEEVLAEEAEGRTIADHGESVTLESAKAEVDAAELVVDVNARVAALTALLSEQDADALRSHALDKIEALKAA